MEVSDDLTCLQLLLEAGAKERLAVDDHGDEFSKNEVSTPTQYIQKKFGNDEDHADAVGRAVDLLYKYSSAGKSTARLEAKVDALTRQVELLAERP